MDKIKILLLNILLLSLPISKVYAWGAVTGFNSHGVVDTSAYDVLTRDSAFDPKTFPSLQNILDNEGIRYVTGNDGVVTGPGPDSAGKSNFSDHYFNPQTGKGNGPGATARHFLKFANSNTAYQDYAWGAHFLADMSVVYHVTGMPYDEFWRDYVAQSTKTGKFILPEIITGDRALLSYGLAFTHPDDFITEAKNIKKESDSTVDWFDPWYWNGVWMSSSKRSSHVAWEMWVRDSIDNSEITYNEMWENPAPSFDHFLDNQIIEVKKLAAGAAANTFVNMEEFSKNSMPPLQEATKNVATLWRASFSGLKPEFTTKVLGSDLNGKLIEISAQIKNTTNEVAGNVQFKFTAVNLRKDKLCIVQKGEAIQRVGDMAFNETIKDKHVWIVSMPIGAQCAGRLEAIGGFKKTPDLQHNEVVKQLIVEALIKEIALSTTINFKYNVTGGKLYTGIHDDGFFQTKRYSAVNLNLSNGPYFTFNGEHNDQQAQFIIKTALDGLMLDTISLKSDLKMSDRETNNMYVIRNVHARMVKSFKSYPGLTIALFYLKGENFLKHIESKKTESWSNALEWDESVKQSVPVHYTTFLTELLASGTEGDSQIFAFASSIPMEQVEQEVRNGNIDRELFQPEYDEVQDAIMQMKAE